MQIEVDPLFLTVNTVCSSRDLLPGIILGEVLDIRPKSNLVLFRGSMPHSSSPYGGCEGGEWIVHTSLLTPHSCSNPGGRVGGERNASLEKKLCNLQSKI